jgi:acyl CoA:acetate/3-ketoacid CoA transferase beta subunit
VSDAPAIDEICVVALAEAFRGDGEILCNPIGTCPVIGGRLAMATFAPEVVMTDTVAALVSTPIPIGVADPDKVIESWMPYRSIFDVVWSGKRHVIMGASQIDAAGNQNLAAIGDWRQPKAQLLGLRGAPGNLINHTTSYWVPSHSTRTFVESVDVVSGPGYDRMEELGEAGSRFHHIKRVVSNLGVFDFENDRHRMQIQTLHPGVSVDDVLEATAFEMIVPEDIVETRLPTPEELDLIRNVIDPKGLRKSEFPQ